MNHRIAEHPDGGVFCLLCNVTASSYDALLPYECPMSDDGRMRSPAEVALEQQNLAEGAAALIATREQIEKEHAEEMARNAGRSSLQ